MRLHSRGNRKKNLQTPLHEFYETDVFVKMLKSCIVIFLLLRTNHPQLLMEFSFNIELSFLNASSCLRIFSETFMGSCKYTEILPRLNTQGYCTESFTLGCLIFFGCVRTSACATIPYSDRWKQVQSLGLINCLPGVFIP